MSANNFILQKVQLALQAYLQTKTYTGLDSNQIYSGIQNPSAEDDETGETLKVFPCIECVSQSSSVGDNTQWNGIWQADAEVVVRAAAQDTSQDDFMTLVGAVFNDLCNSSSASGLSAAIADFTCFLIVPTFQGWGIEGSTWAARLRFTVHCAGSSIS